MAIKYLKGVVANTDRQLIKFRPDGFEFPKGLSKSSGDAGFATIDVLMVGGGGQGGGNFVGPEQTGEVGGGGGGAGGYRLLTSNTFSEVDIFNPSFANFSPISPSQETASIPVIVAGAGGTTCIGSPAACLSVIGGGNGGSGSAPNIHPPGGSGGSGGGGTKGHPNPGAPVGASWPAGGPGGAGCFGQGCNGGPGSRASSGVGGSACANASTSGIATSFTGASVTYAAGGSNSGAGTGTANRGQGGGGRNQQGPAPGGPGGSGFVAIRYCAPQVRAQGGDSCCVTGGCIIHLFNSSSFFNVNVSTNIN